MANKRPLAAIPEPPKSADPSLRAFLSAMKEALEVRLGRRGDRMEEAVTRGDLVEFGLAKVSSSASTDLEPIITTPDEARITPPVPLGLVAEPLLGGVHLTWENPFSAYNVHGYAEVWRGDSNDRSKAILINSSRGATFFDRIPAEGDGEFWYWVRFVSTYDKQGAFSLPVVSRKRADVKELMDQISGQIDRGDLTEGFRDAMTTLENSYFVKLDVSGYASGFGMYNNGQSADFAVMADRFWVGMPGSGRARPFMVVDGITYIDTAMIREASIEQGQLGPIGFGKITDKDGKPVTTLAGKLRADAIDVESLQVTDANISGVIRSKQVASNGQPRWMLDKDGGMTMNGSGAGGRMELRDSYIKVFDANGVKRVQLGDLNA